MTRRSGVASAGLLALFLVLPGRAAAAPIGFSGPYAPANWTTTLNNSNGSVDTTGAPTSITILGSDNGSGLPGDTDFTIPVPASGTISFDWDYLTNDSGGPFFDVFGYLLNGTFVQLTDDLGGLSQSGTTSVPVNAGDVFGFRVNSFDNDFGPAQATISNFDGPGATNGPAIPEPTSLALFGMMALAGGAYYRLRGRKQLSPA
jgi:hypothetical protein